MKFGVICCEDGDIWGGEEGFGKRLVDIFSKQGTKSHEEWLPIYAVSGKLPDIKEIEEYSGFIISGSHHSVNDDKEWVRNLEKFVLAVKELQTKNNNGCPRLFGICYGHQMVAKALGGKVTKNESGKFIWCAEEVNLTDEFKNKTYFQKTFGKEKHCLKIMQSHGESISELPPGASVVGQSATCDKEIVIYGDHILTTQGHPEFVKDLMIKMILPRLKRNATITEEEEERAIKSFENVDHGKLVHLVRDFLGANLCKDYALMGCMI